MLNWLKNLLKAFFVWEALPVEPVQAPTQPVQPPVVPPAPITPIDPHMPQINSIDTLLPWNTTSSFSHENWHNVRVLCDLEGLSHQQKEELCATVWGESEFNTHALCVNHKTLSDGTSIIASEDHGIAQWNSYWHANEITPDQAINDPETAIRLMCEYFKRGQADQWIAHRSGRYKQFLDKTL